MNIYNITKAIDLHNLFLLFRSHSKLGWWFRGQSNSDWPIIPKAGRIEYLLPNNRDLGRFNDWRESAVAYHKKLPKNDWECLALAQHCGLATRLLDWTINPLVATYFAVNELLDNAGAVYCYDPQIFISEKKLPLNFKEYEVSGFICKSLTPRMLNQKSVFTVHNPPNSHIEIKEHFVWEGHKNLAKIIIPNELKKDVLENLNSYGINYVNLFPDLDGLSRSINWETHMMVDTKKNKNVNS